MSGDVALEGGVLRVRLDWLVTLEMAVAFAAFFAVLGVALGEGAPDVVVAVVLSFGAMAWERWARCLVAHGDGLVVPAWSAIWYRRELRWDQVAGIALVDGTWFNRGRKIRVHLAHGWVDAIAPRDGFFARDPRLEEIVELLWRQVPPRGPARPAT